MLIGVYVMLSLLQTMIILVGVYYIQLIFHVKRQFKYVNNYIIYYTEVNSLISLIRADL